MNPMTLPFLGAPIWFWLVFLAIVLAIVAFDLGYLNRKRKVIGLRQSLAMMISVMLLGLAFSAGIYWQMGGERAELFLTALILEQSLSIDNVFVIAVIFAYFAVPASYQHRVLVWGILLAMVLRAIFIGAGTALVSAFEWIMWLFAAFLLYSGYKMFVETDTEPDIGSNSVVRFLARHLYITPEIAGEHFFVRKHDASSGRMIPYATPLFLSFLVINLADIIFAVDSVPAVLSLTREPFIVYTSNIFAILGLRSLYFVINALLATFYYLEHALSILLVFIGGKIIWDHIAGPLNPGVTLAITLAILATAIAASILRKKEEEKKSKRRN